MRKKDIENKIRSAFQAASPDKLDSVLSYCESAMTENREVASPVVVPTPRKYRSRWVQAGALALIALCVSSAFMLNGRRANEVVIGSTDSTNTESITVTGSFESSESESVADTESSTAVGTLTEITEETVSEPTEAPVTEPTEAPVIEPTEAPVIEPTEAPVIEPTEVTVQDPTENTENEVVDTTESAGGDDTVSVNSGEAFCPMPDPEYRSLRDAISVVLRHLADETGNPQYHRKDEVYVYAWLGEADGEAVYYVSYGIGKHRIDCTVPVIYKNEISDVTISPLVVRDNGEQGYIGASKAKSTALTSTGVSEGSVSALNVTVDRYKQNPSYHVTFYYNGSRYFYDLDAVSGKILSQSVYDLAPLKSFIKEQHEDPYYIEPSLLTDDLFMERITDVRRAAETYSNSSSTDGLSVERIVNDDILDIYLKNNGFTCRGEITGADGYLIFYEESSAENATGSMLELGDLRDALKSAGVNNNNILELNAVGNGETFDIFAKTKNYVYKFGIRHENRPLKSRLGNITYFGKATAGKEGDMKFLDADSALQKALDDAGVTEYTLVWNDSIKQEFGTGKDLRYAYYHDITFNSGEYTYKYKVDVFTGKAEIYLFGSGKGDVSNTVYTIGDHTGFSKNQMNIIFNAAKRGFAAYFDGCKLEEIWYDTDELKEINEKYRDYFYANYGTVVGIRFTTGAEYNGIYGLKPNTEYKMYCLVYDNYNVNWQVIGFVFE